MASLPPDLPQARLLSTYRTDDYRVILIRRHVVRRQLIRFRDTLINHRRWIFSAAVCIGVKLVLYWLGIVHQLN